MCQALDDLGKCAAPEGETAKMKMMSFEGFMNDFGKAAPNSMNMSVYRDNFQCACGRSHWFDESIDVVCQGGLMKIMVICPDDSSFLTSLKIKTFMGFELTSKSWTVSSRWLFPSLAAKAFLL